MAQKTGTVTLPIAIEYGKGFTLVRIEKPIFVKPTDDVVEKNNELQQIITNMVLENKKILSLGKKTIKANNK